MEPKKKAITGDMLSQAFRQYSDSTLRPQSYNSTDRVAGALNIDTSRGGLINQFGNTLNNFVTPPSSATLPSGRDSLNQFGNALSNFVTPPKPSTLPKISSPTETLADGVVYGMSKMAQTTAGSIFDIPSDNSIDDTLQQSKAIQEMNNRAGYKSEAEVINSHRIDAMEDATIPTEEDINLNDKITPEELANSMNTISRGTGASDVQGVLTKLNEVNPNAFQDIAQTLKEMSGYEGPIQDAARRSQTLINDVMSQATGRVNEVNQGETERWRQLQAKLSGGAGLSSGDQIGFAIMSFIPLIAKLINKRARVDLAYAELGKAYQQAQANARADRDQLLKEYDMISDNVRQGSVQVNQAASAQINADMGVAESLNNSLLAQYKLATDPEKDKRFLRMLRTREGLPEVDSVPAGEQEKIGTMILVKDKVSQMEQLEAAIFDKVRQGKISKMQMDAILQYSTANGWISLQNLPRNWQVGLMQTAPELYQYQSLFNEVVQLAIKKKSGGQFSMDELNMTKTYNGLLGYSTPEITNHMQKTRRSAFNKNLLELTPAARSRLKIDYITSQIGHDKLQDVVRKSGGTINFNTGTVLNAIVNTPSGPQYFKGSIEEYIKILQQSDPRFNQIKTSIPFEE